MLSADFLGNKRPQARQLPASFCEAWRKLATPCPAQKASEGSLPLDHNQRCFKENLDIQPQRVVVYVINILIGI